MLSVKWNPPDSPWLKLNTASRFPGQSRQVSGRGVILDHNGQLLAAFCIAISATTALEANAKTIKIGISVAKECSSRIWVETDCPQVISLINARSLGPAHSRQDMARLLLWQKERNFRFATVMKEGNKAAIFISQLNNGNPSLCCFNGQSAPRLLEAIIHLEQIGVPNIRVDDDG